MNPVSTVSGVSNATSSLVSPPTEKPSDEQLKVKEAFQDFVAGTLFKEMFKSLRKTHDKPAYFHGGQAEEMFQGQLDQQVAEDLARQHGGAFADPLFDAFTQQQRFKEITSPKT